MKGVSVIIPAFNRAKKVVRAISSVLSQSYSDYEVIVIDDGSSDETRESLDQFKNDIKIIRHSGNRGVSVARNNGINSSEAPLIAFLDSDDHWLPRKT